VVQGRGYELDDPQFTGYFEELLGRLLGLGGGVDTAGPWRGSGPTFGDPRLTPQRLGQQAFQAVVLRAYSRRCAVTGDRIRPVLQAAHPRPLPAGGDHRLDNGLLLRSDVHTLYDRGYLGVDPASGCWSARGCTTSSGTGSSSTGAPGRGSHCRSDARIGRTGNSSSGTWTPSLV
jgi:putative restriction endonuclease